MHLHETIDGWEVVTARGGLLFRARGIGSKRRALRYMSERGRA